MQTNIVLQKTPPEDVLELKAGQRDLRIFAKAALPRKVQALIDHKDFQPKISWIAKALGASIDETQDAIELLEGLGLVSWKGDRLVTSETPFILSEHMKATRKEDKVNNHRIIAHQLLNDVDPNNRFFTRNGFYATDEETLREYADRLSEVIKWFEDASSKSKKTIVVGYSMTGANVVKQGDEL